MIMMCLSLSWICQKDKVSLIVKFGLKKIILFKKNDNDLFFKYYADVENCESFRSFGFIYIYIDK